MIIRFVGVYYDINGEHKGRKLRKWIPKDMGISELSVLIHKGVKYFGTDGECDVNLGYEIQDDNRIFRSVVYLCFDSSETPEVVAAVLERYMRTSCDDYRRWLYKEAEGNIEYDDSGYKRYFGKTRK